MTLRLSPSQVLDSHLDLLHRFDDPRFVTSQVTNVLSDLYDCHDYDNLAQATAEQIEMAEAVAGVVMRDNVRAAFTYKVTEDMVALLLHAAALLDESDLFDLDLAPTHSGLVHFDQPIPVLVGSGKHQLVHWLLWGPFASGGLLVWFNDHREPDEPARQVDEDPRSSDHRTIVGRWNCIAVQKAQVDDVLGAPELVTSEEAIEELRAEGHDPPGHATNRARIVQALWLLLGQTVTTTTKEPVERATRRRAERIEVEPVVSVIRLRRPDHIPHADGESDVEWSRRWLVRGHWRWQPCGPRRSERKRIWVHPYVKGPEDAPLVITKKIYVLER